MRRWGSIYVVCGWSRFGRRVVFCICRWSCVGLVCSNIVRFGVLVCLRFRFGVICGICCLFWFICIVRVWCILMLSLLIFFWGFGVVVSWVILDCWWSWV